MRRSGYSFIGVFICIGDQQGLDCGQLRNADGQGFAAFGAVLSGMEVVRVINSVGSDEVVERATLLAKRCLNL